jgi:hypothetical protein
MLTRFTARRTFCKLVVTVHVDVEQKAADVTLTYDRIIKAMVGIPFDDAATPELAEKWMSRPFGEYSSIMEYWESGYRSKAA